MSEIDFLRKFYPLKGKKWCADKLNRTIHQIRSKTYRLGLKQDRTSDFNKDWQIRAAQSKMGKKRPDQAEVMKRNHKEGKLVKTQEQRKAISIRQKKWILENGHPRGMLGRNHTDEFKMKMSVWVKRTWENMTEEQNAERTRKILLTKHLRGSFVKERTGTTWKSAWRLIGAQEKFYRSAWEANYARYLEFLKLKKEIKEWQHEPDVFWFEGIKRGCVSYLPDFKVTNNDGSIEYHEVKGWMDDRSKTKIKRMAKYYPSVRLIIIQKKQYDEIRKKLSSVLTGWE